MLSLQARHPITIVVRGGESTAHPGTRLDMYAYVDHSRRVVTYDDDSAGDLNSRLIITPTEDGEYVLGIRALGDGIQTGAYEVEILDGAHADAR